MRENFYEFYKLPEEVVTSIWENGLLIVDTNVLLDLYRLGENARTDLQKSIEHFGSRVWIPYQVGLEFHRNRESVIDDLGIKKYEDFDRIVDDVFNQSKEGFKDYHRHPCIDYEYIEHAIERLQKDLKKKCKQWKEEYPFSKEKDNILEWVTATFDGKTGEDDTPTDLLAIYKEGEIRYKAQVPPGYKDVTPEKRAAGSRYVFGDLIIWKSVLRKAKTESSSILFLTNDAKEDWYEREKGQTKGPRFELIREFHKETEQDIIIMSEAGFLREIKNRSILGVTDSSIEDAEQASSHVARFSWPSIATGSYGGLRKQLEKQGNMWHIGSVSPNLDGIKTISELIAESQKKNQFGFLSDFDDIDSSKKD